MFVLAKIYSKKTGNEVKNPFKKVLLREVMDCEIGNTLKLKLEHCTIEDTEITIEEFYETDYGFWVHSKSNSYRFDTVVERNQDIDRANGNISIMGSI